MKPKVVLFGLVVLVGAAVAWAVISGSGAEGNLSGPPRPPFDFSAAPVGEAAADAPNVILISIDSLRADHLGCYGYERDTSPNLDRLAAEGTLFEQPIASSSWTLPTHMAMLTSMYDSVHQVRSRKRRYVLSHPLLAEVLQEAGYDTAGFYAGALLHPGFGFDSGFDDYVNCTSYSWAADLGLEEFGERRDETREAARTDITSPRIHEKVTGWLDGWLAREEKERFFLFIHYWDVHYDYIPPAPYDTMFDPEYDGSFDFSDFEHNEAIEPNMSKRDLQHLIALYDGEIRWTDEWIGKLFAYLAGKGIYDETLIIVTADHGEEFFDHGMKGHRKNLHDETVRVPLIVRWPGRVAAGRRVATQVRSIDIYPTIVSSAGLDVPGRALGRSLLGAMAEEAEPLEPAPALIDLKKSRQHHRALRTEGWKLIDIVTDDERSFYDLAEDPGERSPIALDADPRAKDAFARLQKEWLAFEKLALTLTPKGVSAELTLDAKTLAELKALGYIK